MKMPGEFIKYEKQGKIALITIDRPEVLNALHPPAVNRLDEIWNDFDNDPDLWVAILTSSGDRAFCVGADLKWRVNDADENALRGSSRPAEKAIERSNKPVIAAVKGYAVGGGLELLLHCDIIIAAENARFGLPEARRGLMADTGGTIKLPRQIPYHLAMGMLLTGDPVDAREAWRYGIVNEVVQLSDLMPIALSWAEKILECSPLAVRAAKEVVRRTIGLPPDVAMNLTEGLDAVRRLRSSKDYSEGPKAFAEKRKPEWKGV